MRKLLTITLCVAMILSLGLIGVHADEPTVINTAEDFAAIVADGNYKLGQDIAVSAKFNGTFTGTFDGNGHTITLSGDPIFKTLDGATVSNLVIAGSVSLSDNAGGLCINAYGITVTNVTNKADITTTKKSGYAGGMVGQMSTSSSSSATNKLVSRFTDCVNEGTISGANTTPRLGGIVGNAAKHNNCIYTRCVNKGAVKAESGVSGSPYVAGIAGSAFGAEFYNCENYGELTSAAGAHMGGILGRMSPSAQGGNQDVIMSGCKNFGNLTTVSGVAGGIVGYVGNPTGDSADLNVKQILKMVKCENTGNITAGGGDVGGIVGYLYGVTIQKDGADRGYYSYVDMTNCVNRGNVAGTGENTFASQFLGYSNCRDNILKNNYGFGTVTTATEALNVFIGLSGDDITQYLQVEGNYVTVAPVNYSYAASDDNAANRVAFSDPLVTGKVTVATAAEIEAMIAPSTPTTGDGAVWFVIVGAVALLGAAVAFKARKA